jgi:N-methylhydantoinase A
VSRAAGEENALCFDMGGTSCDVCVIDGGAVREESSGTIAGRPLALPMVAVHTVGAGGGSIAWRDAGGALRVGPRSAGAQPGPACYGRGGTEPTVTDANLLLGYLSADSPLAGDVELDRDAAQRAVGDLAGALGLDETECAEGIIRVANAEMVRALRVVTVQRGIDPRRYALLAFGGAGGLHAAGIAEELGIDKILCPRASGVLSALGLVVSPRRRDVQRSVFLAGDEFTAERVAELAAELGGQARDALGEPEAELRAVYELRYRGQAFELPVAGATEPAFKDLREGFEVEHEERYGYRDGEQELELVTIRLTATVESSALELHAEDSETPRHSRRRATLGASQTELEVWHGAPSPGDEIDGPAVIELAESTLLVAPDWRGSVHDTGTIVLERRA